MTDRRKALLGAIEQLNFCRYALTFFEKKDESARKFAANIILQSARAISFGFEAQGKKDPIFRTWYSPFNELQRNDPVYSYLRTTRNIVVHESGTIDLCHTSTIPLYDPKPGVIAELIADGSQIHHMSIDIVRNRRFLVVRTPEGKRAERDVPQRVDKPWWELVEIQSYFRDAPEELSHITVVEICQRYVGFLERMLSDAATRFGSE